MGRMADLEHACPLPLPGRRSWRDVFASGMDWSHWDYPLLLPLSIVRGWKYMGNEQHLRIPAAFALLFTLLTLGLLLCALAFLRSRIQGISAAMILLGTPLFIIDGGVPVCRCPARLLHAGDPRAALPSCALPGESVRGADSGGARRRFVRLDKERRSPVPADRHGKPFRHNPLCRGMEIGPGREPPDSWPGRCRSC